MPMTEETPQKTLHGFAYEDSETFHFEAGLPGFEHLHRFLLAKDPSYEPFEWLCSVDDASVRFVMVNPVLFRPDYAPKVTREHLQALGVSRKEDLRLLVTVTLQADFRQSTANLAGPVLFNVASRQGMQLLLDDSHYGVREPILTEPEA